MSASVLYRNLSKILQREKLSMPEESTVSRLVSHYVNNHNLEVMDDVVPTDYYDYLKNKALPEWERIFEKNKPFPTSIFYECIPKSMTSIRAQANFNKDIFEKEKSKEVKEPAPK